MGLYPPIVKQTMLELDQAIDAIEMNRIPVKKLVVDHLWWEWAVHTLYKACTERPELRFRVKDGAFKYRGYVFVRAEEPD